MIDRGCEPPAIEQDFHAAIGIESAVDRKQIEPGRVAGDYISDHDMEPQDARGIDEARNFVKRFDLSPMFEYRASALIVSD